jgi:hypothetical protein
MKNISYLVTTLAITLSGCSPIIYTTANQPDPQPEYANTQTGYNNTNYDNSPQTDQVFYDELSPYGTWIDYPDYGYVWMPNAGDDFRPYATNGYWVYSDYGWTWFSNYSWGWAPFHYGRWFYDDSYGWLWVPGHEWAPAWVIWGDAGDYYCWAPIAPGVDLRDEGRGRWAPSPNSWNIVPRRHITQLNVNDYMVRTNSPVFADVRSRGTIINNTTNNTAYNQTNNRANTYNRGPGITEIENVTNSRVQQVKINDNKRPGAQLLSDHQLLVYRPAIKQNTQQGNAAPAPRKIETFRPAIDPNRQPVNHQSTKPEVNQRLNDQLQNQSNRRPDFNQNHPQNPIPGTNNQPQSQQNRHPIVDQRPVQNPRLTPNNQPQNQQNRQPVVDQSPAQNPIPRTNNQPQNQRNLRPEINQNPAQNPNSKANNPPQNQQDLRPGTNQNPGENPGQRPTNQPQGQNPKGIVSPKNGGQPNAKRKADSLRKLQ